MPRDLGGNGNIFGIAHAALAKAGLDRHSRTYPASWQAEMSNSGGQAKQSAVSWPDAISELRQRASKDQGKAKRDALLRRVRGLCQVAGVKRVVSHSLRGLNATLRLTGGATDEAITRALGHVDISTTRRSDFAPGIAEQTDARRAHGRLLSSKAA